MSDVLRVDDTTWKKWQTAPDRSVYLIVDGDELGASDCETCIEDRTTSYHERHDHARYHGGYRGHVPPSSLARAAGSTLPVLVVACPDGGTCHHECRTSCFRVRHCGPLSGVFAGDQWPSDIAEVTERGVAHIEAVAPIVADLPDADSAFEVVLVDDTGSWRVARGGGRSRIPAIHPSQIGRFAVIATTD